MDLVEAVGYLVPSWGHFEWLLHTYLLLLRMKPSARSLEPHMPVSFKKKADLLRKTVRHCFRGHRVITTRIGALVAEAKRLSNQRNRVIHGMWYDFRSLNQEAAHVAIYRQETAEMYEVTPSELDALCIEINELSGQLHEFLLWGNFPYPPGLASALPSSERAALQTFVRKHCQGRPDPTAIKVQSRYPSFRQ